MRNSINSFQELECWKSARQLRLFVKEIINTLPKQEQFDLIDNMRRASRSCTRNIAEGFGRFHFQENIQFCRISRGSMTEIWDDFITCFDDKYITKEKYEEGEQLVKQSIKIINGYILYLEKAKNMQDKNITSEPDEYYGELLHEMNK